MNGDDRQDSSRFVNDRASGGFSTRLLFGLVLVTLGVLWTLDNLHLYDASKALQWWGVVPLLWGLLQVLGVGMPARRTSGALWMTVGAVAVLHNAGWLPLSVGDLWPLILIFIGARIVSRHFTGGGVDSGHTRGTVGDTAINTFSLWAGNEYKVVSQAFRGGEVSAVMAGSTVDLRSAQLEGGRATIEVFTIWGGIEIVVPRGWRIQGDVTPILAGFEDSTMHATDPNAPVLVVRGFAVMGGVEVKNTSDRHPDRERDMPVVRTEPPGGPPRPIDG